MAKNIETSIKKIIEDSLVDIGYQIASINTIKENDEIVLRICIDKEEGYISLEDCQIVNQLVDPLIDQAYPDPTWDALQISSPGIDRELIQDYEFNKFKGFTVNVGLYKKMNGQKKYSGILKGKTEQEIIIEIDTEQQMTFNLDDVAIIKLEPKIN